MSNSSLVTYTKISPNRTSPRNHKIDTITIHCTAGNGTAKQILNLSHFVTYNKNSGSSCNYAIGKDGSIGLCVEEKDRSWCSSSRDNDHRAITIEVSSSNKHPYEVSEAAYKALINLLVDICERNNIKKLLWQGDSSLIGKTNLQNMTVHRWFAAKACPGDYLYSRHGQIAKEVNSKLGATAAVDTIYRVQTGSFKNKSYAEELYRKVKAAKFTPCLVQDGSLYKVQVGAFKNEVNAKKLATKLEDAGFATYITTKGAAAVAVSAKKTVEQVAKEVIAGKWGTGSDRKTRLTKAGYDYAAVQKKVNELL